MTLESIEVLDPTISPRKEITLLADRPETLDGSIVGLLANGKRNSEELLKYVYEILNEKHNLGVMITDNKGNASLRNSREVTRLPATPRVFFPQQAQSGFYLQPQGVSLVKIFSILYAVPHPKSSTLPPR